MSTITSGTTPSASSIIQSIFALCIAVTLTDTIRDGLNAYKPVSTVHALLVRFIVCAIMFIIVLVIVTNYTTIEDGVLSIIHH